MVTASTLLLHIFLMFISARLAGELCERLRQPAVIGELLVGMTLGPFAFFFSSRRRHTMVTCDWSSDVCASDLLDVVDGTEVDARHGDVRAEAVDQQHP